MVTSYRYEGTFIHRERVFFFPLQKKNPLINTSAPPLFRRRRHFRHFTVRDNRYPYAFPAPKWTSTIAPLRASSSWFVTSYFVLRSRHSTSAASHIGNATGLPWNTPFLLVPPLITVFAAAKHYGRHRRPSSVVFLVVIAVAYAHSHTLTRTRARTLNRPCHLSRPKNVLSRVHTESVTHFNTVDPVEEIAVLVIIRPLLRSL